MFRIVFSLVCLFFSLECSSALPAATTGSQTDLSYIAISSESKTTEASLLSHEASTSIRNQLIKLNVPYISQNDSKSCATTSVVMAISYLKNLRDVPLDKETVWRISRSDENIVFRYGNDMEGLRRIADYYDLNSKYLENMEIADVENCLSRGIPVVLNVACEKGSPATHSLLATGYDKAKRILYINDPANRENRTLSYSDLEDLWMAHLSSPRGMSHRSGFIVFPKF